MNKFEKRKFKNNLYKHGNTIMYIAIFFIASVITIAAAVNRTDKTAFVDESKLASSETESLAIKNSKTNKVASTETAEQTTVSVETTRDQETTERQTNAAESGTSKSERVRVITETLYIRAESSTDAEIIGMAGMNDTYDVISRNGDWIEIDYDGTKGYINSEFTENVQ